MKILIIEDQQNLAEFLKTSLEHEGHVADYLLDKESGETRLAIHHKDYDVVILDLMLPQRSGEEVSRESGLDLCRAIRELDISIPILILTAREGLEDKVALLNVGADDYLTKPFQFDELLARIKALSRRPKTVLLNKFHVEDLTLDVNSKTLMRGEEEIRLTLTEFRLLEYLFRHLNRVVEREDIVNNIWDFDFDSFSNIVDVYINKLRTKIDSGRDKKLIETIRGVGYRIKT